VTRAEVALRREIRRLRDDLAHARWRAEALHLECLRVDGTPPNPWPGPPTAAMLRAFRQAVRPVPNLPAPSRRA